MSTSEHTNAILRAAGDVLLQLGADAPRRVPNTPVNAAGLNASVEQYQKYLDALELEIMRSVAEARRRAAPPPPRNAEPALPRDAAAPPSAASGPDAQNMDLGLDQDGLGQGLDADLDGGLDARLDGGLDGGLDGSLDADLFNINTDGLGIFGDTSSQQNFSMDDDFF